MHSRCILIYFEVGVPPITVKTYITVAEIDVSIHNMQGLKPSVSYFPSGVAPLQDKGPC